MQEQPEVTDKESSGKALISFGSKFMNDLDEHWKAEGYRSRSEYIICLIRLDMLKGR